MTNASTIDSDKRLADNLRAAVDQLAAAWNAALDSGETLPIEGVVYRIPAHPATAGTGEDGTGEDGPNAP